MPGMPRPKWQKWRSSRPSNAETSQGNGRPTHSTLGRPTQSTLSRFFSPKQKLDDSSDGGTDASNVILEPCDPGWIPEQESSLFGKRSHELTEEGSYKRQRLDSQDTTSPCGNGSESPPRAVLTSDTREKLNTFLLDESDTRTKREPGGITIEELKRSTAQHLNIDFEDGYDEKAIVDGKDDSETNCANCKGPNTKQPTAGPLSKFAANAPSQKPEGSQTGPSKGTLKYTPLEQQFMEIKRNHSDAVLFVECGYKYRFFGSDAEIAAKELNIYAHMDHNFMTASIPTHRLYVHVRRLVSKGYKVGVVKQTETAALKAAGDNRNTPFIRQLSALYTKATLIGEDVDPVCGEGPQGCMSSSHLMCIYEPGTTSMKANSQRIAIVCVQPATGEIIYDVFEDTVTRSELETRITHIQPAELLLPPALSAPTEKLIDQLAKFSCLAVDRLRVERMEDQEFDPEKAAKGISDFFSLSDIKDCDQSQANKTAVDSELALPPEVNSCLHALLTYLRDFNLHNVLKLKSNYHQFSAKSCHMHLNGSTLKNLEVFRNTTDGKEQGSLIWVLDHTVTRFGARQLRKWLARPLIDARVIMERQEAVGELMTTESEVIRNLRDILPKLPDLERGLCTIFHKKCSTQEFISVCKALESVNWKLASHQDHSLCDISSQLLRAILTEVPDLLNGISDWVSAINEKAARDGDKTALFVDDSCFPGVVQCKKDISDVKQSVEAKRKALAKQLGVFSLEYKTVLGTEYLIEVKNAQVKQVPKDWIKVNSTKAVSRFHTPFIISAVKQLGRLREQLTVECTNAWLTFLGTFEERYLHFQRAVEQLATLDCLLSLSTVAKQEGFCRPFFIEEGSQIHVKQGRHPVVDILLGEQEQYVPNDTHLKADELCCMVITGPNMGGKSSYIKQVALLSIMAQIGSYVPAEEATLGIIDAVYTRMGASDELFAGRSTFMVELQEASEMMAQASHRSLVILDELGRGTSTHDGVAIAFAALRFFVEEVKCLTLFVTHYPPLTEIERMYPSRVLNYHMSFLLHDEDADTAGEDGRADVITFLYQLVEGKASRSYGLNVARLASIPTDIIKNAATKSRELEIKVTRQRRDVMFKQLWTANTCMIPKVMKDLDHLL